LIPVCPEQLGGLKTPRPPQEIQGGSGGDVLDGRCRVKNINGDDVTYEEASSRILLNKSHRRMACRISHTLKTSSCRGQMPYCVN